MLIKNGHYLIILDLCGGTGAWSKPYADNGYLVLNITLPEYDVRTYIPPKGVNIYGILAAPPCTKFSLAAGKKLKDRDVAESLEILDACLKIIWECKPKFWALENPVGYMRRFLGKPPLTFKQWEFGDMGIKPTDIWGFFNIPNKKIKEKPHKKDLLYISAGCSSRRETRIKGVAMRGSETASVTPPGFAKAFYEANK